MNASRLREIIESLLGKEKEFRIQETLQELNDRINELVTQPQNTDFQNRFSQTLDKLKTASASVRESIEPVQITLLQEIGADKYFVHDFTADISNSIRDNPITPAVTQQKINTFRAARHDYLQKIGQLRDIFEALHIKASALHEGDAEIGFLLPRTLFENRLEKLITELRDINRIIRAFSEVTIGGAEDVEVRQISTSDPLFYFHLAVETIAALGGAVTWALHTWKQVEEIRKLRLDSRDKGVFSEEEAKEIFDKKISEKIDAAVKAKVNELAKDDGQAGRGQEQRNYLAWALEAILARVERGMIVEIRLLPPKPEDSQVEQSEEQKKMHANFQALLTIVPQLVFPKMEGSPTLKLKAPPSSETRD